MSGIYIHIPFCKQACHYCDFHFSTNRTYTHEMTEALCKELKLQQHYLQNEPVETIYFGGGTPSLLSEKQLSRLLEVIYQIFPVVKKPEITLEANPDDLDKSKLKALYTSGINRLSIGIQSFQKNVLQYLNRAHDHQQAETCISEARNSGFSNISIDLIYAIPAENHDNWNKDLDKALSFQPEHISSYCLTIEPKTAFGKWLNKGKILAVDDDFASDQFEILYDRLGKAGYEQYEVSNFCLPELYSRHNSGYWKQEKYLGIGPSAHSFNGLNRQFNISNNHKYMAAIDKGEVPYTLDRLELTDRINEYLLTSLRTKWGVNMVTLRKQLGYNLEEREDYLKQLLDKSYARIEDNHLILTKKGFLLADKIASDMFMI